jgi:hypothetical protein
VRILSKVAVVIPIYKEELDDLEKISLAQVRKVLGKYPIIFVAPEGKNFSYLEPGEILVQFHPQYFQSGRTYSKLLLSPFFYEPFLVFDYILIYQLDAFVFYDALEEFCRLGWDYIGAAFPVSWGNVGGQKNPRVGNGGFSLRKVNACYKLLMNPPLSTDNISEDVFFILCGADDKVDFQTAPVEVAKFFSMEHYPDRCLKRLRYELPFGCHGWTKISADFYVELFAKLGYDLRPFRAQMRTNDYEIFLPQSLEIIAMQRLIRDLDRKKSLVQYLPIKHFATVRVVKSSDAMKILARLLMEENSLTDKIFIYDEKDFRDLIDDVTRENLPHLVIASDYDKPLIEAIENKGLNYGKHVISFQREYLKFQEKLFHNLGR